MEPDLRRWRVLSGYVWMRLLGRLSAVVQCIEPGRDRSKVRFHNVFVTNQNSQPFYQPDLSFVKQQHLKAFKGVNELEHATPYIAAVSMW